LEFYPERTSHISGSGEERLQLSITLAENHFSYNQEPCKNALFV